MKKIFTKLIGVTLGLAMAVGVGVGVAANNRKATMLDAANGDTLASGDFTGGSNPAGWTVNGNGYYANSNGLKFTATSHYVISPSIYASSLKQVKVGIKAGYNGSEGSVLTVSALDSSDNVLVGGVVTGTVVPSQTYTTAAANITEQFVELSTTNTIAKIKVALTSKTSNLGVKLITVYDNSPDGDSPTVTSISASLKDGNYYAGNTLSASDFNVTANWSEGDPTHPTSGFTWTVNGVANGTLALGSNTIVVTYQEATATISNFQAIRDPRWNTGFSNTKVASIELPESGDTAEKYYVTAKVTAITSTKYGNGNAVDEDGTEFAIYGMYSFDGAVGYENMVPDHKPVAGDIVVLYGVFTKYNDAPEIKSAWVVQRNSVVLRELSSFIDLSTNTTTSVSDDTVTWGDSSMGMLLSKGTSGTKANNYVGGLNSRTSTRFYNGQTVVIGYSATAVKMLKVYFTATTNDYATELAKAVVDNGTITANDAIVAVTVTKGTTPVTIHVKGTCGFTKVQFVYEEASAAQKIECGLKTSSSLTYDYVKNGENDFTISNVKVRFGGKVSKALWDGLTGVEGFGVMLSAADTDPAGYIGEENFKDEYAVALNVAEGNIDDAIDLLCDNTKIFNFSKSGTPNLHEAATDDRYTEDTYAWTIAQNINDNHLTRTYVAIAYIRTSTGLVFLQEERISVQEIADRMVTTGNYDEDPMFESLSYLANL